MSTLKQKLASRANGKLSRGPITEEGKRISAANAIHHGMLANSYVLSGEARERFEGILDRLDTEFEPETESEQALVDMMAIARWRQMRLWGYEKATIAKEIERQENHAGGDRPLQGDAPTQGAAAFRSIADTSRSLDLLNRYEAFSYRMFIRSKRELDAQKRENAHCEANPVIDLAP